MSAALTPTTATEQTRRVVTRLWEAMEARDWETVGGLLADDFVCEWPVSRERFRGRDNFIAVNRNYPGEWHVRIARVIAEGERAATEVIAEIAGKSDVAVSFYELREGRIVREVDYWPEPYPAPAWREAWAEEMSDDDR
jgi:ketosteroid isomerase-like protein